MITRFYRTPAMSASKTQLLSRTVEALGGDVSDIATEYCYYVESTRTLSQEDHRKLRYLIAETFEPTLFGHQSFIGEEFRSKLEVGPRLNFETPWSTSAVEICHRSGITGITRFERSRRFGFKGALSKKLLAAVAGKLHDPMTEMCYPEPLTSFETGLLPTPVQVIPIFEDPEALERFNCAQGCGWDNDDKRMIRELFTKVGRNPTDVELFQIAQANSDHSRHWFFRGRLVIDGVEVPEKNLMEIIKAPLLANPGNSAIAFCDDSSAIEGFWVKRLIATDPTKPSELVAKLVLLLLTLTAETHNFPTGVAPFPGAATGTGGRIRDNQAVGRGGLYGAGSAGYMTGNLHIPGYPRYWESNDWNHPSDLASPLDILIQGSNGASAYGNCFGEPVIYGVNREVGLLLPNGSYTGYFKPIMYTSGAGAMDNRHTKKGLPEKGMLVVQLGGPAYRIGMGGSSASSREQGENTAEKDQNAVQRGNPEMEQRMNRAVRGAIELGDQNPFISAHDLGAGGDCNALPEIVDPTGAVINLRSLPVGDKTLSTLEIWGNESQERNVVLVWPEGYDILAKIAERENTPIAIVGHVTGDGLLILFDEADGSTPVNLPLTDLLGKLPAKTFQLTTVPVETKPLVLPEDLTFERALERVFSLVGVGSKAFLTRKVDRSVTGLVAQQQCIGPLHTPVSDFALLGLSYEGLEGQALSLGEQPLVGLLDPAAGARMTLAEALLNLAGIKITSRADIKAEANCMLAAKKPGQGANLYRAYCALRDTAIDIGLAFDGGKDSSSMASTGISPDGTTGTVVAPMTLVIAPQATVRNITVKATADLKREGNYLLHLPVSKFTRLGGSALAQAHGQLGEVCPDIDNVQALILVFDAVQSLLAKGLVEAVHDVSDGGLVTTILEMAIAGNKGVIVDVKGDELFASYFAQEAGLVIETGNLPSTLEHLSNLGLPEVRLLGEVAAFEMIALNFNGERVLTSELPKIREMWERTSFQLERQQTNPECVAQEERVLSGHVPDPRYRLNFTPARADYVGRKPKVAILREEGSNGDREMAGAFVAAGFEAFDVNMKDLELGTIGLGEFQAAAFVGGFSFGDVLDSGKGWSSVIRHNARIAEEITGFLARNDTLSLGVCNGCQVMALTGIPGLELSDVQKPRFITNSSERFESRFPMVEVLSSPSIWFDGMAGSRLGIWTAHGEGNLHADPAVLDDLAQRNLTPLRYVDNSGEVADGLKGYPFNPNGSPQGITAICSPDGRHLAMMPHPERVFLPWQWPWKPESWRELQASPWLRFFQNAHAACK